MAVRHTWNQIPNKYGYRNTRYAYRAVGEALEVIPRSLAHNCGVDAELKIPRLWGVGGKKPGKELDLKDFFEAGKFEEAFCP